MLLGILEGDKKQRWGGLERRGKENNWKVEFGILVVSHLWKQDYLDVGVQCLLQYPAKEP
jgi:hypothetical protein